MQYEHQGRNAQSDVQENHHHQQQTYHYMNQHERFIATDVKGEPRMRD